MGFKLGTARQNYSVEGEIKNKFKFSGTDGVDGLSVPGNQVISKPMPMGVAAEASKDGNIYLNENIDPDSFLARKVVMHEMKHATEMKLGKLAYEDDHIMYNGEKFIRQEIDGKDMIQSDGKWLEAGDDKLPWEKDANGF